MEIWGEPMEVCFSKLRQRVLEAVETTDLDPLFRTFENINGPTAVTGVGGSSVVAAFSLSPSFYHHVQRAQGMVFRWILILKNVIL